ncbi:MAG: epoxide hydrolase family protein [Thermomicrobiales bacterium]
MTTATGADNQIAPFTIAIPQADLDDLRERLSRIRFPQVIPGTGWRLGTDSAYLEELATYWRDDYDWRAWEAKLNAFPQFITEIDGQRIHVLHIQSEVESATPLILLHGWPGSFVEFLDVIGPLTDPVAHGGTEADAFHLVIPTHPGFGFSGPLHELGWTPARTAVAYAGLMTRLGYERFGMQGGDTGSFIGPDIARAVPGRVIGLHLNAATYGFIPWGEVSDEERETMTPVERERLDRLAHWNAEGSGYFSIQGTRPQTLAFALADSPVGQLAWLADIFNAWTDNPDGIPGGAIDRDWMLTDVMLYWLTNTSASSAQTYWESMHAGEWPTPVTVPTGVAVFAQDVAIRRYAEDGYPIVHWSDFERGGHFAAMEAPDLLVGDIRAFFAGLRA